MFNSLIPNLVGGAGVVLFYRGGAGVLYEHAGQVGS